MTYTQAKLIIWNHRTYTEKQLREAVVFILGSLSARQEDISRASLVYLRGSDAG